MPRRGGRTLPGQSGQVLALFYAARRSDQLFKSVDMIYAPLMMMLLVSGFFYAWLTYSNPRS
jgi:hypothetical protein